MQKALSSFLDFYFKTNILLFLINSNVVYGEIDSEEETKLSNLSDGGHMSSHIIPDADIDFLCLHTYNSHKWNPFNPDENYENVEPFSNCMTSFKENQIEKFKRYKNNSGLLRKIYNDLKISGYENIALSNTSENEETPFADTYGEILYISMEAIIQTTHFEPNDVFYELGSGVGKFNLYAHLATKIKKSIGIEISKSRHDGALIALEALQQHQNSYSFENDNQCTDAFIDKENYRVMKDVDREVLFINADVCEIDMKDATIIFMASVCFPEQVLQNLVKKFVQLKPGLCIISLKKLPFHRLLRLKKVYHFPTSWAKSFPYHYYELSHE